jgi:hypothetical protein
LKHGSTCATFASTKTDITMKALIKVLFFDREVVENAKAANPNPELLYTQLISGKITLKEYVAINGQWH